MLEKLLKKTFNLCSHIESNTQNPNPIFKIRISFTKTPKMPKYFRNFGNISKTRTIHFFIYFVLCINYIIHFCNCWKVCNFCNFVILGFLYWCHISHIIVHHLFGIAFVHVSSIWEWFLLYCLNHREVGSASRARLAKARKLNTIRAGTCSYALEKVEIS